MRVKQEPSPLLPGQGCGDAAEAPASRHAGGAALDPEKQAAVLGLAGAPRAISPYLAMMEGAILNGAALDVLEKLMTLQERYEASVRRCEFDEALARAKTH